MTLLGFDDVSKRYGSQVALNAVSLCVERGSTVALVGPNGAGKSTLIGVGTGLRSPDQGTVRVLGRDPRSDTARRAFGAVLQESAFPQTLRVVEVVAFAARHYVRPARIEASLELLG